MRRSPALAILAIVVAVLVIALGFSNTRSGGAAAELNDYAASPDGLRLVVTAIVPPQCTIDRTSADESGSVVIITVTLACAGAARSAAGAPLVGVPFTLKAPLADRVVVDANGNQVSPRSP